MKQINALDLEAANRGLEEASQMQRLRHERLVRLYRTFLTSKMGCFQVNLVMELCEGGDLSALIKRETPIMEARALWLLHAITAALSVVHAAGVVHRDVKPANVLVAKDGHLKLGDLGLARRADAGHASRGVGTLGYMSPSAFTESPSATDDIWSLGVVAVELASGLAPQGIITPSSLETLLATIPPSYSASYHATVRQMLSLQPALRPTASQLLQSKLLRGALLHPDPSQCASPLGHISPSVANLAKLVDQASWIAPLREPGLNWKPLGDDQVIGCGGTSSGVGGGQQQSHLNLVKICTCDMTSCDAVGGTAEDVVATPEYRAARRLLDLINSSPGNASFAEYEVERAVLCDSRHRAHVLLGKAIDLHTRLHNAELFDLQEVMTAGSGDDKYSRLRVLQRYMETYPTLCTHHPVDNVRVWLAFHAAPSEEVAKSILRGSFAQLQKLDAGYFGKGIYMTLDAAYAVEE